jgi:hypothetical protein
VDNGRRPNPHLRRALSEAGWTEQQLATAVNDAGREIGETLSYDRTTVAHWLAGARPRPPGPGLLAEVFSRRLGRAVTPADLGLGPVPGQATRSLAAIADSGLPLGAAQVQPVDQLPDDDVVPALVALARAQATTGTAAAAQPAYSLAGLAVPGWPHAGTGLPAAGGAATEVTAADVLAAERLAWLFGTSEAAHGGGQVRRAAAFYLAADLAPKLAMGARAARRRRLLSAATEIAYLCAFMSFDDELNGLGQRYYRVALRLAAENGDQAAYAITLRGMSVQASVLGHRQQALQLAEAAAVGVHKVVPVSQAFLFGQLAVARAAEQDRAGALASLAEAERSLSQATSGGSARPLIGAYNPASLAHQRAAVQSLLGDDQGAIAALAASITQRPRAERRSRAVTLATLGELQLTAGHLDEAITTWHGFLDDYPYLKSARVTTALGTLRRSMRPHARNATARALLQRAAGLARRA